MKKNVIKMTFAAVCVVAAGVSGMKAYNATNQSEANLLLSENIEALSSGDGSNPCNSCQGGCYCYTNGGWQGGQINANSNWR